MDQSILVLILSFGMLIGCYLVGMIPLYLTYSQTKLRLAIILGAGFLVGYDLAVIIPEGIHAMYHTYVSDAEVPRNSSSINHSANSFDKSVHEEHDHGFLETHSKIGVGLVLGFVFMLIMDQVASSVQGNSTLDGVKIIRHSQMVDNLRTSVSEAESQFAETVLDQVVVASLDHGLDIIQDQDVGTLQNRDVGSIHDQDVDLVQTSDYEKTNGQGQSGYKLTASIGLVIHSAADGIALGAAMTMSGNGITAIVSVVIMLQKAPVAFGLVSFLLHEGLSPQQIRNHLIAFCAVSPVIAVAVYTVLMELGVTISDSQTAGFALLFSGGTVVYVATVNVIPEISNIIIREKFPDGTVHIKKQNGFTNLEQCVLVIGCLLPLLQTFIH